LFTSVVDPHPHGSALIGLSCRDPYWECRSGFRSKEIDQNFRI